MASVWETASRRAEEISNEGHEAFVLVCGSPHGGKSALVSQYLNPSLKDDTPPRPTLALDYSCCRKPGGASRDVAHIWEIGTLESDVPTSSDETPAFTELTSIALTPQRLAGGVVLLVVDLSSPRTITQVVVAWVRSLRQRLSECKDKMQRQSRATNASSVGDYGQYISAAIARLRLGWAQRDGGTVQLSTALVSNSTSTRGALSSSSTTTSTEQRVSTSDTASSSDGVPTQGSRLQANDIAGHLPPSSVASILSSPTAVAELLKALAPHPDETIMAPTSSSSAELDASLTPLRVVLVGTKWDLFMKLSAAGGDASAPEAVRRRRAVMFALRYIAIMLGGCAIACTSLQATTVATLTSGAPQEPTRGVASSAASNAHSLPAAAWRGIISSAIFCTQDAVPARRGAALASADSTLCEKPLVIAAGGDSLSSLGLRRAKSNAETSSGASNDQRIQSSLAEVLINNSTPYAERFRLLQQDIDNAWKGAPEASHELRKRATAGSSINQGSSWRAATDSSVSSDSLQVRAAAVRLATAGTTTTSFQSPPGAAALAAGTPAVFMDEAAAFPEVEVDELRVSMAEELGRLFREQDRKLKLEGRAATT